MQALKLTENHKEMILEMCKTLFPNDTFSFQNDCGDDGILDRNFINPFEYQSEEYNKINWLNWDDEGSHFHWYEFCCCHLVNAIVKKKSPIKIAKHCKNFGINLIMLKCHPVEYLYEEFKKIK